MINFSNLTGKEDVHPSRTWLEFMNSTRPEADQVCEDEFGSGLKKHGIDQHALTSYECFVESLKTASIDERPDWFNDLIESDPPSSKQIKNFESKSLGLCA